MTCVKIKIANRTPREKKQWELIWEGNGGQGRAIFVEDAGEWGRCEERGKIGLSHKNKSQVGRWV